MLTIGPDAFHVADAEQDNDLSTHSSEEGCNEQSHHQHYHLLRTSGKVPAGFLHYLTSLVSKQGYEVVLETEKEV